MGVEENFFFDFQFGRRCRDARRYNLGSSGQALVEFAIMLVIFMALASGILYINRLLIFDYWAQQEARFLAFEQDWAPHESYEDPNSEPQEKLDPDVFKSPRVVNRLEKIRNINNAGDMTELLLLSKLLPNSPAVRRSASSSKRRRHDPDPADEQAIILAARRSRKPATTDELLRRIDRVALVDSAYAAVDRDSQDNGDSESLEPPKTPSPQDYFTPENRLERGIVKQVKKARFGRSFCAMAAMKFDQAGFGIQADSFRNPDCPELIDTGLGIHLARTTDFKQSFRDFGYQIDNGLSPHDGLEVVVERGVAAGFYSFFDTLVKISRIAAVPLIFSQRADVASGMAGDDSLRRISSEIRYVGSIAAVNLINVEALAVGVRPLNRDVDAEKQFEDDINDILQADGPDDIGVGNIGTDDIGFLLPPSYLPFNTPILIPLYGGLTSGAMFNVLDQEHGDDLLTFDETEPDLFGPLVDDANKLTEVTYDTGEGIFPAARRRFKVESEGESRKIIGRFFLVTQPWHITRRNGADGDYREIGTEDDSMEDDTEEAVLRRRTFGLFIFPARLTALLRPVANAISGSGVDAGDAFNTLSDVGDGILSFVKEFILDNPLNDFMHELEALPGFNFFDFTLPRFPSVRPAAYPFTEEFGIDKSTGQARTFDDFIKEQLLHDPEANPKYQDMQAAGEGDAGGDDGAGGAGTGGAGAGGATGTPGDPDNSDNQPPP